MGHFAPDDAPTWESITLARFLRQLPPQIELIHDAGDQPLRWVEPSDMDDPTGYLMEHELILTSGFPLRGHIEDQEWVDRFINQLAQANASALGFGLEPYFSAVPRTVRDACRRFGLNLLQIPSSVPFAAIGIAFAKLIEADSAARLRANAEANRALMRCVAQPDAEQQLVATLSQRLKASAKLITAAGRIRHSAGHPGITALDVSREAQLVEQAMQNTSQQPFALLHQGTQTHLAFPLRAAHSSSSPAPPLGGLLLGFAGTPSAFDHHLIATALGLLELLARERASGSTASAQLATSLLLRSPAPLDPATLKLLSENLGAASTAPVRVAIISPTAEPEPAGPNFHLAQLQVLLDSRLAIQQDAHFIVLTRAEPTSDLFERLSSRGYLAGFSRPAALDSQLGGKLGKLHAQASGLLPQMLESQQGLDARALPRTFASLLPAAAGKELAEGTLAPLLELPEDRRDLYLEVLRGWLDANGSWDQASRNIDLHRNSVRRHIAAIGEILGLDLNRAEVRHELFLALNFLSME